MGGENDMQCHNGSPSGAKEEMKFLLGCCYVQDSITKCSLGSIFNRENVKCLRVLICVKYYEMPPRVPFQWRM